MTNEQKEPENTLESVLVDEPETETQNQEPEPIPEVVESTPEVTETLLETVPEPVLETPPETEIELTEVTSETETAQMGGNDPLVETSSSAMNEGAGATAEAPEVLGPIPTKEEEKSQTRKDEHEEKSVKKERSIKEKLELLRQMAHATITLRREKKYVKIMELFAKQTAIKNDEVEKLLHVSDATATRYLAELEKRGKLKQVGTTGCGVSYIKR